MMRLQYKSSIILICTFILGMFLGTLIDRTIMRYHFKNKVIALREPRGFFREFERIIQPDETQREKIKTILTKHSKRIAEIGEKSHLEMRAAIDSIRAEIDPILTDEQKKRLNNRLERMRNWRRKRGPHFDKYNRRFPNRPKEDFPPPPPPLMDNE